MQTAAAMLDNRTSLKAFRSVDDAGEKRVSAKLSRTCKVCKRSYCSIQSMRAHMRFAHARWSFGCSQCLSRFYAKPQLVRHCVVVHSAQIGQDMLSVTDCSNDNPPRLRFSRSHVTYAHVKLPHRCAQCLKRFFAKSAVVRHCVKSHGMAVAPCAEFETIPNSSSDCIDFLRPQSKWIRRRRIASGLQCQKCGRVCAREDVFEEHSKRPHVYGCANCPRRFITKHLLIPHLQQHLIQMHRTQKRTFDASNRRFGCSDCLAFFKQKYHLIAHVATIHQRAFAVSVDATPCQFCGQYFEGRGMSVHMRLMHSDLFRVACFYCPKKFISENAKYEHEVRFHGTSDLIKCDFCSKKFFHASTKEDHVTRCHLEEAGGSRSISGFQPRTSPNVKIESNINECLKLRRVIWPKVKFECDYCSKSFSNRLSGVMHLRMVHSQDRAFVCEHCDETFCYPLAKRNHVAKEHKCGLCDIVLVDVSDRTEHMRSVHPEAKDRSPMSRTPECEAWRTSKRACWNFCNDEQTHTEPEIVSNIRPLPTQRTRRPAHWLPYSGVWLIGLRSANKRKPAHPRTQAKSQRERIFNRIVLVLEVQDEDIRWECMRPRGTRPPPKVKANCEFCSMPFTSKETWVKHMRSVHQQARPLVCEHCGETFRNRETIRTHIASIHRCRLCDDVIMMDAFDKEEHMRSVHGEAKSRTCKFCCREFPSVCGLRAHLRSIHADLLGDPIQLRPATFTSLSWRHFHANTLHLTPEERYKCGFCAETFARLALLHAHVCTVRKRACEHCGKSFNAKDMVTHLHTEHPYAEESEVTKVARLDSAPVAERMLATVAEQGLPCTSVVVPHQPTAIELPCAPVLLSRDQLKPAHPWIPPQQRPLILRLATPLTSSARLAVPVATQRVAADASSSQSSLSSTTSSCQRVVRVLSSTIQLVKIAKSGKVALVSRESLEGRQLVVTAGRKNAPGFERHPGEEGHDIRRLENDKSDVKRTNAFNLPKQDSKSADCSGREVKDEIMDSD